MPSALFALCRLYAAEFRDACRRADLDQQAEVLLASAGLKLDALIEAGLLAAPQYAELRMRLERRRALTGRPSIDARRHFIGFVELVRARPEFAIAGLPAGPWTLNGLTTDPRWVREAMQGLAMWLDQRASAEREPGDGTVLSTPGPGASKLTERAAEPDATGYVARPTDLAAYTASDLPPRIAELLRFVREQGGRVPMLQLPERLRSAPVLNGSERRGLTLRVTHYGAAPTVLDWPNTMTGHPDGWQPAAVDDPPERIHIELRADGWAWLEECELADPAHVGGNAEAGTAQSAATANTTPQKAAKPATASTTAIDISLSGKAPNMHGPNLTTNSGLPNGAGSPDQTAECPDVQGKPLGARWYFDGKPLPADFDPTPVFVPDSDIPSGHYECRLNGKIAKQSDFYDEFDTVEHLRIRAEIYGDACRLLAELVIKTHFEGSGGRASEEGAELRARFVCGGEERTERAFRGSQVVRNIDPDKTGSQ